MLIATFYHYQLHPGAKLTIEETGHQLDGVRPALVDVVSAVTSKAFLDLDTHWSVARSQILALVLEIRHGLKSAGATDEHLPLIFRIEVDQGPAGEETWFHAEGAVHPSLLRDGEHALKLAHRKVALQQSQHRGHTDAVIGTESCVFRDHPTILDLIMDRVG